MKRCTAAGPAPGVRSAGFLFLSAFAGLAFLPSESRADETVFVDGFESAPNPRTLMPWGWERVSDDALREERPALPRYNVVLQLAESRSRGGRSVLVFRTLGEGTALRLAAPVPVRPGRAYTLSAWGRGVGLESDRLRIDLEWLDARGRMLRADTSDAVPAPAAWARLAVIATMPPPKAESVRPILRMDGPDVRGEGWFDDVELREHVHLTINSGTHPGNLFRLGEPVEYTLSLHGADPGTYEVHRTVETLDGEVIVPRARFARTSEAGGTLLIPDRFAVPRAGYFESRVQVRRDDRVIAERTVPLGILDDELRNSVGLGDFGTALDPAPAGLPPPHVHLETLLAEGGLRRVKVPLPPIGTRDEALDDLTGLVTNRFAFNRFELIGMLQVEAGGADPNAKAVAERTLCARLRGGDAAWWEGLSAVVRRYRGDLKMFQVGFDEERSLALAPDLDALLARVGAAIKGDLTFAAVGIPVPWPAPERGGLEQPPFFFAVHAGVAPVIEPPPAWLLAGAGSQPPAQRRLTLRTQPLGTGPTDTLPRLGPTASETRLGQEGAGRAAAVRDQLADLARRAVSARRFGWSTIYVAPLYGLPSALLDAEGFPTPAFHAWRTLNALLTGAAYDGPAFAFTDVESHVFRRGDDVSRRGDDTVVVLWATREPVVKEFWLGDGVRAVDLAGRAAPLANGAPLRIGPEPVFLLGVTREIIRTQRAIAVEPAVLDLREHEQTLHFILRNEFPDAIKDIRISRVRDAAGTWTVAPQESRLPLLAPGKSFDVTLSVRLPFRESPGTRDLTAEVHFEADKPYTTVVSRAVEIRSPLKLTLQSLPPSGPGQPSQVAMEVRNLREPTGKPQEDAERVLRVRLTTTLPTGSPLNRYFDLPPGGTSPLLQFPLRGAAGRVVAVLHEIGGDHFLARSLDIQ